MDESYIQWLLDTSLFDREGARAFAKRFPKIADLASALPDAIAEAAGLSLDDARNLKEWASEFIERGDRWYRRDSSLFLCPGCGSFVSSEASSCPQCGVTFEEEKEEAMAPEEAVKAAAEAPELYICSNCGAFLSKDAKKCSTCGQAIEEAETVEEELPQKVVTEVEQEEELRVCSRCGAFISPEATRCGICGKPVEIGAIAKEIPEIEGEKEGRGVSKDFLERWKRVAEKAPTREEQLAEELRHYDELLQMDPRLEKAWVLKAHVLRELGRGKDAARCLEKAATLNPEKEEEYRLQVFSLAEALADTSIIPQRWAAMPPPARPEERLPERPAEKPVEVKATEAEAVQRALSYYDLLVSADPMLDVAWETRAELLKRIGRQDEAAASLATAQKVREASAKSQRRALEGLRTAGLPRVKERPREGRVNGLVNGLGRVNGLVNGVGRVNGLVNGVGRVNGLVRGAGRVNGLVNGLGRVNGLVNGVGRVNGLVNGNGFTNGRTGRFKTTFKEERGWLRSSAFIASVLLIFIAAPLIAGLLSPTQKITEFRIDGSFSDWQGTQSHRDALFDTKASNITNTYRPELDLVESKVAEQDGQLALYAKVNGELFNTSGEMIGPGSREYLIIMIDTDWNPYTGYRIGGLGADDMAIVSGWAGQVVSSSVLVWHPELGGGPNNISAFRPELDLPSSKAGGEIEMMVPIADPSVACVLTITANATGVADAMDGMEWVPTGTLIVSQRTLAPDVVTQSQVPFLGVRLLADAGTSTISALNVSKTGSMPNQAMGLSLYQDNGDDIFSAADQLLGTSSLMAGQASFNVATTLHASEEVNLFVIVDLTGAPASESLTLSVTGVQTASLVDFRNAEISGAYYQTAPPVTIDGLFGDWDRAKIEKDAHWDIRSVNGSAFVNENVDIAEVGVNLTSDLAVYMRVFGSMLGGEDVPNLKERPQGPGPVDSDIDSVPDLLDRCPFDFNNDWTLDNQTNHDVDGDGVMDYPSGPDYWLNTTIPSDYSAPYAGRVVSRYIGPISYNLPTGADFSYAYVDSDNSSSTGLWAEVDSDVYGIDYALAASGRGGRLDNASLYRYVASSNVPFAWVSNIPAAIDYCRLEMAANANALHLLTGYRIVAYTTDWLRNSDNIDPGVTKGERAGTRSVNGDNVVINEVTPRKPSWIEVANPMGNSIALNGWVLQTYRGGRYQTIYSFTSEVLGPWLSGTEYFAANLNPNVLPNGGCTIVLRDASRTIVDETAYPAIGNTQSWSRFKGAVDGKPVDTDQVSDWYISAVQTPNAANDRTRPIIGIAKTVNVPIAEPGDFVQYTLYHNNTGDGNAGRVWINDTLPVGVQFQSSSVPPISFSGQDYYWVFNSQAPGAQSFTITARVTAAAQSGTTQSNVASLEYVDQLGKKMQQSKAWANFTVRRPAIKVEKTASPTVAVGGDTITYTIYFNNTGTTPALKVWINDTLPKDVTYLSSSIPFTSRNGQTLHWYFANVMVGSHSFTIQVRVNMNATGSILVNWVFLNYTTSGGFQLEESKASATVYIPEFTEMLLPIVIPIALVIGHRRLRNGQKREAVADSVPTTDGR